MSRKAQEREASMMFSKQFTMTALATVASATVATAAQAATTPVNAPYAGEASHADIFAKAYGGTFTATANGFTNGVITAQRIDDSADQTFSGGKYSVRALAAFAALSHSFGYVDGGVFSSIFDVVGTRYAATGSGEVVLSDGFSFARAGSNGVASTLDSANSDGKDHVVSYRITGLEGLGTITVLFFEDLFGGKADWDFQDLVVEVTHVAPTPTAMLAGVALMGMAGLRRRTA